MPDAFYPPPSFYFKVKVEGVSQEMSFQEVSGLNVELQTEEVKEGGVNVFAHKLPRQANHNNLVLKRGIVTDPAAMGWIKKALENFTFSPKTVELALVNNNGDATIAWTFRNAYPVAVKISDLKVEDDKVLVESLEIAYDHFTRKDL